jgi:hypothetical protein
MFPSISEELMHGDCCQVVKSLQVSELQTRFLFLQRPYNFLQILLCGRKRQLKRTFYEMHCIVPKDVISGWTRSNSIPWFALRRTVRLMENLMRRKIASTFPITDRIKLKFCEARAACTGCVRTQFHISSPLPTPLHNDSCARECMYAVLDLREWNVSLATGNLTDINTQ